MPAAHHRTPRDVLDAAPQDVELLEEIQLMSELMVAASSSSRERLHPHEVDALLGLSPGHAAIPTQRNGIDRTSEPVPPRSEQQ